jgi:hypothetical protein
MIFSAAEFRSFCSNEGRVTWARFAYARWTAWLLCPSASWAKRSELLRCYGRVGVRGHELASVENLVPVLAHCRGKALVQNHLGLEARVGIGRLKRRFCGKNARFCR